MFVPGGGAGRRVVVVLFACLLAWNFGFCLVGLCVKKYFVKLLTIVSIS